MNSSILWRLVWKEYRNQRNLWLAVAGLAIAAQLIFVAVLHSPRDQSNAAFIVAIFFAGLFSLGGMCVSFASETEDGTADLLRILAPSPSALFVSKLGFVVIGTIVMFAALAAAALVLAFPPGHFTFTSNAATRAGIPWYASPTWKTVETFSNVFVWGLFASLVTRRVLNAACVTAACLLIWFVLTSYLDPYHLVLLPAALALDYWIVRRWAADKPITWWGASARTGRAIRRRAAAVPIAREETSASRRLFTRLLWQEWRQARNVAIGYTIGGGLLLTFMAYLVSNSSRNVSREFTGLMTLLFCATPVVMGVWAFRGEQANHHFRFLCERGVAPKTVWLSKHLVWLTTLVAVAVAWIVTVYALSLCGLLPDESWRTVESMGLVFVQSSGQAFMIDPRFYPLGYYGTPLSYILSAHGALAVSALSVLAAYAVGQLVSMLIPRAVTGVLVGLLGAGVAYAWIGLMLVLGIPMVLGVVPVPAMLLATTLVRAPDWMLERNNWRAWTRVAGTVLVPMGAMLIAIAVYRVHEIPAAGPGFSVEEIARPPSAEARKTAEIYRRAGRELKHPNKLLTERASLSIMDGWEHATPMERQWLDDNQETIRLTLQATARKECALVDFAGMTLANRYDSAPNLVQLGQLLLYSARQLEAQGDLDEALERYRAVLRMSEHAATSTDAFATFYLRDLVHSWIPLWAAHPGQSGERIRRVIAELNQETPVLWVLERTIRNNHAVVRHALADGSKSLMELLENTDAEPHVAADVLDHYCPWERTRALRVLDMMTAEQLRHLDFAQAVLARRASDFLEWQTAAATRLVSVSLQRLPWGSSREWAAFATTPVLTAIPDSVPLDMLDQAVNTEARRRAAIVILALVAWRHEQGALPGRLDELTGFLDEEPPLDPWTGREFGYRPAGFPNKVDFAEGAIEAGRPLLWSAGPTGARVIAFRPPGSASPIYVTVDKNGLQPRDVESLSAGMPMGSLLDMRKAGLGFPIP